VHAGLLCTPQQATQWFLQDTQTAVDGVNRSVSAILNQNQFDALVAFAFNVGVGAEGSSTLVKLLNSGDYAGAAAQFPRWNKVNGVPSEGLTRRRAAEQALFLSPA
jgi:lysozyme